MFFVSATHAFNEIQSLISSLNARNMWNVSQTSGIQRAEFISDDDEQ